MTVPEMHIAVKIGVDKTSSLTTAAFEPEEINYWLNEAQLELVKQKMFGTNYRKEDYDMGVKRADDLSKLIVYSDELIFDPLELLGPGFRKHSYHPNIAVVNITEETMPGYLFYIGADFLATSSYHVNPSVKPMETVLIKQSQIGSLVETPHNRPVLRNGYIYLKEGEVNVIYDPEATPYSIYVSYLKKPRKLVEVAINSDVETVTSDLPEQVHPELVALAVKLMLENIESPRQQSFEFELRRKE